MAISTVSKRYARALLEIGIEEKAFEGLWHRTKRSIRGEPRQPRACRRAFQTLCFKLDDRKALAKGVLEKLGSSDMVSRFIGVLIDNARINELDDICDAYFSLEDELKGRVRVTVETPGEPVEGFIAGLKERLGKETGKEVIISHDEKPGAIGRFLSSR